MPFFFLFPVFLFLSYFLLLCRQRNAFLFFFYAPSWWRRTTRGQATGLCLDQADWEDSRATAAEASLGSREGLFASKEPGRGLLASHRRTGVFGILTRLVLVWIETTSGASVNFYSSKIIIRC